MLDLIQIISNPILKDGVAVVAVVLMGLFLLIKHLLKFVHDLSNKAKGSKEPTETRMEAYFREAVSKYELERKATNEELRKINDENIEYRHKITKLLLQIRIHKGRIKYLEFKLTENQIAFSPAMDHFDD